MLSKILQKVQDRKSYIQKVQEESVKTRENIEVDTDLKSKQNDLEAPEIDKASKHENDTQGQQAVKEDSNTQTHEVLLGQRSEGQEVDKMKKTLASLIDATQDRLALIREKKE